MRFEGDWVVQASVPGGGAYDGTLTIARRGGGFALGWRISAGEYVGIGLAHDDAWYVACGERLHGLGLAIADETRGLRWIDTTDWRERHAGASVAGDDRMRWQIWGDGPFQSFAIRERGAVHEFDVDGTGVRRGLAFPAGTGWALAWYPDFAQTVLLRYARGVDDDQMLARWALGGHTELADERLTRPAAVTSSSAGTDP